MTEILKNLPPQNLEAEQQVLGAALIDNAVLRTARVRPEDFYATKNGAIWKHMRAMSESGEAVDLITLTAAMRNDGLLERCGGASYLSVLIGETATAVNFVHHEKLVMACAMQRRIIHACQEEAGRTYSLADPDEVISSLMTRLADIRSLSGDVEILSYDRIVHAGYEAIERNFENARSGKLAGITTGFKGIDDLTNGLQKNWFYVFAGRTGKGKTSLAMQMARGGAKAGHTIGIISVEMDPEQLAMRDISSESGVDLKRINSGRLFDQDFGRIGTACGTLRNLPIYATFSAFTAEAVDRAACHLVHVLRCEAVFVDYLQLLTMEHHEGTREQEVSKISRMHKRLAKQLHVPVVALAQLNRGVESRSGQRPVLSDLRESGSIEQDADLVAFIHQDECKCPLTVDCSCGNRYRAWYLQRKGRMNGTGDVPLGWDGRITSFRDAE